MSNRRFTEHFKTNSGAQGLRQDHPALHEGRTIFPTTVVSSAVSPRVLVSGKNQRKIGDMVAKGRWRGMPIFCVTLEERATCPRTCHNWDSCYGNNMHMSRRHRHDEELEAKLAAELNEKQREHPGGFVVRLHILGDFPDEAYVLLWRRWLLQFPALRIFGYTARHESSTIGALIASLNVDFPDRVWLRFSVADMDAYGGQAITVADAEVLADAIICPAQTGKSDCCATCGLCWTTPRSIAFLRHGGLNGRGARNDADDEFSVIDLEPLLPAAINAPVAAPKPTPHAQVSENRPAFIPDADLPRALRAIEIRAWLRQIIADPGPETSDEALLAVANLHRARRHEPPFRLIRERRMAERLETIT